MPLILLDLGLSLIAGAFATTPVENLSLWGCNCGSQREGVRSRFPCSNENENPHLGEVGKPKWASKGKARSLGKAATKQSLLKHQAVNVLQVRTLPCKLLAR